MPPEDLETDTNHVVETEEKVRPPTKYELQLRKEAENQRLGRKSDADKHTEALRLATEAANDRVSKVEQAANERIIRAEIKAEAIKAGIVDLEALKMLDFSSLKLNDKGEVEGGAALIEAAKIAKPYLFGKQSTSSTKAVPKTDPDQKFHARTATPAAIRAFERSLGL